MSITDVTWVQDRLGRRALDLRLDGHPAHFVSSQRGVLLERGILEGIVYLDSERLARADNPWIRGVYAPALRSAELVGCTDDPGVFDLFMEMCQAIRTGAWAPGARQAAE